MSKSGKIVLTASGKRGVLPSGKVALFNSVGECPECCEEAVCPEDCSECPETQVVFSGWTGEWGFCNCVNNLITLTPVPGYPCQWYGVWWDEGYVCYHGVSLYCLDGFWVLDYTTCHSIEGFGTYSGTIPAKPCPAGEYVMTWVSAGEDPCTGVPKIGIVS